MAATGTRGGERRLGRRVVQLYAGLLLYGASAGLMVRAELGLSPWEVFHQGLSERVGLSIGIVSVLTGALVLLLWLPLRERPGLGTVSNVILVGLSLDGTLLLMPQWEALAVRWPLLLSGIVLNGVATGLYIAARFGAGPRDGLMTGLHRRTGVSVRVARTGIEVVVLVSGYLLGGGVGAGTALYALAIGPLAQRFLRVFSLDGPPPGPPASPDVPTAPATPDVR